MVKSLRVTKTVKKKFEWVWSKLESKTCFRDNHGKNIWEKLLFSCEIVHYGESSTIFQHFFASSDKIFILAVRLSTRLDLIEGLRLSWCSLISKIVSLDQQIKVATNRKLFSNSWDNHETTVRQSHMPCLLLITALCFTYGPSKIWKNIRKSQNIMTMVTFL